MSRVRDRRQEIICAAIASAELTPAQKLFLITAATLAPEYVDGERRHGSKAMGHDGHFSLHYDYLGRALGISPVGVKRMAERLSKPDPDSGRGAYLSRVHTGTFGRPTTWHALVVRGNTKRRLTVRLPVTPYAQDAPSIRGNTVLPLPYKTPDHGDHDGAHASYGDHRSPEQQLGEVEGHTGRAHLYGTHLEPGDDQEATA